VDNCIFVFIAEMRFIESVNFFCRTKQYHMIVRCLSWVWQMGISSTNFYTTGLIHWAHLGMILHTVMFTSGGAVCRFVINSNPRPLLVKGVMTWTKVTSLVCRFWSLPWTNGPNTQFKRKLRYSPILCAYLEPSMTYFSNRRRTKIGLEIGN